MFNSFASVIRLHPTLSMLWLLASSAGFGQLIFFYWNGKGKNWRLPRLKPLENSENRVMWMVPGWAGDIHDYNHWISMIIHWTCARARERDRLFNWRCRFSCFTFFVYLFVVVAAEQMKRPIIIFWMLKIKATADCWADIPALCTMKLDPILLFSDRSCTEDEALADNPFKWAQAPGRADRSKNHNRHEYVRMIDNRIDM